MDETTFESVTPIKEAAANIQRFVVISEEARLLTPTCPFVSGRPIEIAVR